MKKIALTLAFTLTMVFGANAQSLLGRDSDQPGRDVTMPSNFQLVQQHGLDGDQNAESPLGSGVAVLLGLGAAYLVGKKRREE